MLFEYTNMMYSMDPMEGLTVPFWLVGAAAAFKVANTPEQLLHKTVLN